MIAAFRDLAVVPGRQRSKPGTRLYERRNRAWPHGANDLLIDARAGDGAARWCVRVDRQFSFLLMQPVDGIFSRRFDAPGFSPGAPRRQATSTGRRTGTGDSCPNEPPRFFPNDQVFGQLSETMLDGRVSTAREVGLP